MIEQPAQLLDETEWKEVKNKATERDEFSQPCVICKEDIGKMCHVSTYIIKLFLLCFQLELFCVKKLTTLLCSTLRLGSDNAHLKSLKLNKVCIGADKSRSIASCQ